MSSDLQHVSDVSAHGSISDNRKVNVLIIGTGMYVCGRMSENYGTILPAVMQFHRKGQIDNLLVASQHKKSFEVFDTKFKQLAESTGTKIQYNAYPSDLDVDPDSYQRALEELPDPGVVIIATPDHLHYEMALAAIESGKHVLVMKPLVPKVVEAQQLVDAAENAGVYCAVEFHKRLDNANLKLRDVVRQGTIGDPLYFHVEYSQRKTIPTQVFLSWLEHTSIFQYLGVHYADIIQFVTGDRPIRMLAIGQNKWLRERGIAAHDSIQVLIEWSKGFVSTILTNWIDPESNSAMSNQMIKVIGTEGRYESDQTDRGVRVITDTGGLEEVNPYFCQPYKNHDTGYTEYRGYGIDSITQFLNDAMSIVDGEHIPADFEGKRPTFRDALISTAIVEGASLSLKQDSSWVYFDGELKPYTRS